MRKLKKLKNLKLTDSEKKELFLRVQSSIRKLPDSAEANFEYPVPSPFYRFAFFPRSTFVKAGVLALLVLSLSSGAAYASLGALPGDLLYGIKVNVVEKISKITALTPESRARAETMQIERRINEFEKLAEKGELTEERTKIIEKNIDERLRDFDRNVSDIRQKPGKADKRTLEEEDLDSRLEKHAENIVKIREEKAPNKRALETIIRRVETQREEKQKEENEEKGQEGEERGSEEDRGNDINQEENIDGLLDL
jgi:hypothetical protein